MFVRNQIVFDCERQEPCFAYESESRRETHFISASDFDKFVIAMPESIEDAKAKMKLGVIFPAPLPPTHCPRCFNWKSNHADGACLRDVKTTIAPGSV